MNLKQLEQRRAVLEQQIGHLQDEVWRKDIYIAALEERLKKVEAEMREWRERS